MSTGETEDILFETSFQRVEHIDEEPSHALFAAWQNCALNQANASGDRAFQRDVLGHLVESAIASQGDPTRRDTICMYGEITDYFWFGNDSTPLPRGLKRYLLGDEDMPILTFNFERINYNDIKHVASLLGPLGLDQLLTYRRELFDEQAKHLLRPMAEALITNTPGYRLLESFNQDRYTWDERPLTPVERILEERAAEESIRRRHGISATDELFHHPAARMELSRSVQRLDETTRYDRHIMPENESPAHRAIAFFKNLAAEELGQTVPGTEIHSIKTVYEGRRHPILRPRQPLLGEDVPDGYPAIRIATDAQTIFHTTESFITWAQSMDYLSSPSEACLRRISTSAVTDALVLLLDDGAESINYSDLLQALIDRYTDRLMESYRNFTSGTLADREFNTLATLLVMPTEYDEELESIFLKLDPRPGFDPQRTLSRREYRRASRTAIGAIKKRPADDNTTRIIQYRDTSPAMGSFDEDAANLVLKYKTIGDGLFPVIPGYQPLGYDAERKLFGLRYTPEADPYAECGTLVPDAARLSLANTFAGIGLHELAMLVHGAKGLTVSQLTRDISRTNRYILPRQSYTPEHPGNLADYAAQVGPDGRLHMQCVGSSHFLFLTLKEVFGPDAASIINGDTLPKSGRRITLAGHQQTTFTDPETNQLYILDATSAGLSTVELRSAISGYTDSVRRFVGLHVLKTLIRPRTAPQGPQKPHFEAPEDRAKANPAEHRKALLEQNRESLILQLRMIHGAHGRPLPHDSLMEKIAGLHPDDIVFRTLSTTILSTGERADPEEPERILLYIQSLKNCDDRALLRRVDLNEYTRQPRLLNALEAALGEIARLNH